MSSLSADGLCGIRGFGKAKRPRWVSSSASASPFTSMMGTFARTVNGMSLPSWSHSIGASGSKAVQRKEYPSITSCPSDRAAGEQDDTTSASWHPTGPASKEARCV